MQFRSTKYLAKRGNSIGPESSTLRAFAILELIATADTPPSLEALTRTSGLPKPTVYRILMLLIRGGLVQREVFKKRYTVGRRLSALSLAVQMCSPSRVQCHSILARLVEEIGETCNFTMLDGNEVVYLDRVETSANVRLHMEVGSRVPLHCTASGKLFLAHLAPGRVSSILGKGPLKRYTERTIIDVQALARELRRIRANGVSTDVGEYLPDSVCLAVPVIDPRGRLCAGIAVHGPAPRMTLKKGYAFLPAMRRATAAIAEILASAGTG
jgi:IclR family transcriptional regulator, acetate operon repressor